MWMHIIYMHINASLDVDAYNDMGMHSTSTLTQGDSHYSLFDIYMNLITNSDIEEIIRHTVN